VAWLVEGTLAPQPDAAVRVRGIVGAYLARVPRERAALVCGAALRAPLAEFLRRFGYRIEVFSYGELTPEVDLRPAMVLDRSVVTS
jgi:flagellar biosynthesis component FlhA